MTSQTTQRTDELVLPPCPANPDADPSRARSFFRIYLNGLLLFDEEAPYRYSLESPDTMRDIIETAENEAAWVMEKEAAGMEEGRD